MWRGSKVGAEVEDDFEVCWSCSTARSGASYEEFHADIPGSRTGRGARGRAERGPPGDRGRDRRDREAPGASACRHAPRGIAARRLLLCRPGHSGGPRREPDRTTAPAPALAVRRVGGENLVVDALADGFVVAFLYGAACGRASPVEAAARALSRLPSLVGAEAIVGTIFVAPFVVLLVAPPRVALWRCAFALQIYLAVRLIFRRGVIVAEAA